MQSIDKLDPNLAVRPLETSDGFAFYDAGQAPLSLCGLLPEKEEGAYVRLPGRVARATNEGVTDLRLSTAGGRVRFRTNSRRIAVRATYEGFSRMPHMPLTGNSGLDLYVDNVYSGTFVPSYEMTTELASVQPVRREGVHDITVNLPLYNRPMLGLLVGVEEGASLLPPTPYSVEKPVVYYGSSITQGGCASRPGNAYQAILTRRLDCDHINLGFSGSARGELPMARYIASLDMSCFVMDYDHNAPSAEALAATHESFFRVVREAHPGLPILLVPRPDCDLAPEDAARRFAVLEATYRHAREQGDENVYLVQGRDLFGGEGRDGCTVDGCHPNDLGFYRMAECLYPILRKVLKG